MDEIQWVPGFIRVTGKAGSKYWIQIAEIIRFDAGKFYGTPGSYIELKGQEDERFAIETPEQIADLIRQEWEHRISLDAEIRSASTRGERL